MTSAESRQLIIAVTCFQQLETVPTFLIIPRHRMKDELLDGAPPETGASFHPSGWMKAKKFC
jgi:hypothetical protein